MADMIGVVFNASASSWASDPGANLHGGVHTGAGNVIHYGNSDLRTKRISTDLEVADGDGLIIGRVGTGGAGTGSTLQLQAFTTAERTNLTGAAGMICYNSSTANLEWYNGTSWVGFLKSSDVTLDAAYDGGGSALGKTINVDAGSVTLLCSGTSVSPLYISNSRTAVLTSLTYMEYTGNQATNFAHHGLWIDYSKITTCNHTQDSNALYMSGKVNAGTGSNRAIVIDANWDYGLISSSPNLITSDVKVSFGSTFDTSLEFVSASAALVVSSPDAPVASTNSIVLKTGASQGLFSTTGGILIYTGNASNDSGLINIGSGAVSLGGSGVSGAVGVGSGAASDGGSTGPVFFGSGAILSGGGSSGNVTISTGNAASATSGTIAIYTGSTATTRGDIDMDSRNMTLDATGLISLDAAGVSNFSTSGNNNTITINTTGGGSDITLQTTALDTDIVIDSQAGTVYVKSGSAEVTTYPNSSNPTGGILCQTGAGTGVASGAITMDTGNVTGAAASGLLRIQSGTSERGTGSITLETGNSSYDQASNVSGSIFLKTGNATVVSGSFSPDSGYIDIRTGESASGSSGDVYVITNQSYSTTGAISILTGNPTNNGTSGTITSETGPNSYGATGNQVIKTGAVTGAFTSGSVQVSTGNSSAGNSGDISLQTGTASSGTRGSLTASMGIMNFTFDRNAASYIQNTNGGGLADIYITTNGNGAYTSVRAVGTNGQARLEASDATGLARVLATSGQVDIRGGEVFCKMVNSVSGTGWAITERLHFGVYGSTTGLQLIFGTGVPSNTELNVASGSLFSRTDSAYGLYQKQGASWVKIA